MAKWVTRAQWGARPPRSVSHNVSGSGGVAIHHVGAGRYVNADHNQCVSLVRTIQNMHMNNTSEGYVDIAYSLVVCHHGYIFEGRSKANDPRVRPGSNGTSDANYKAFSVLTLCGLGDGTPPTSLVVTAAEAVKWLRDKARAGTRVSGHRDWYSTSCPGNMYAKIGTIKSLADRGTFDPVDRDDDRNTIYIVQPGDTLTSIAEKFGVSVDAIAAANSIEDKNKIYAKQKLVIPGANQPAPDPKPQPKPDPKPTTFPRVGDNKVWPDFLGWGQKDSDSVRCLQRALIGKGKRIPAGATGNFGPQTKAAVISLTGGNGLVGPNTAAKVLSGTPYALQSGFGVDVRKWNGGKVYSGWTFYGNRDSDSVRNIQQRLIDLGFGIPAGPTGNYFGQTKTAVTAFQSYVGLAADGVVGANTLRALFVAPKQHYLIVWGK